MAIFVDILTHVLVSGEDVEPALQGNNVKVLVEETDGGNYTCHLSPGGEYLNHTAILVQLDPDNRTVILEEKSPTEGKIRKMEGAGTEGRNKGGTHGEKRQTERDKDLLCHRAWREVFRWRRRRMYVTE